ncbi:MAG: DNA-directed RNA polymerase subunit alpha [Parcubacteria group bacterium Athens1014_10]|nr:MAG: DNA-directed RNA polymerase subunit alpha [Parcubacteria group bacterium Athens1014_10]TSD06055.1 MAG: DNA-directed RNA polymerase subunit alpha [Parcubacteria group bacterium Athens0714_12]
MQTIPLPSKVEIKKNKENKNQAEIIIEPCYPGFGVTLGNALRRVLLSSLPGGAVIAAKIKGATHEFSTLPNVKEDVLEIILNLKSLRIKLDTLIEEPIVLNLKAKGEKAVKAKDIETIAGVRIINPDLKIATLTDEKSSLDMKLWIGEGRGYSTSEEFKKNDFEVGVIICDAIFTPVIKVSLNIENIRVGDRTDYDKLILNLETDGSIDPLEALMESSKILVNQFGFITGDKEIKKEEKKEEVKEEIKSKETAREEKKKKEKKKK